MLPNPVRGARIQDSLKSRRKPVAKAISKKEATVSVLCPSNPNMSFDKAVEMLDVLGYEIVIQERKPGARRADQIVIDQKEGV